MMNERNGMQELTEMIIISAVIIAIVTYLCFSMGVITLPEKQPDPIPITIPTTQEPQIMVTVLTPEPTPSPVVTPDTISEFAPGIRMQGEIFSFRRDDIQGLKDAKVSTTSYGYKFLPKYEWFSEQMFQYFYEYPAPENKFIAVYIAQWEDGKTPSDDSSIWGFNQSKFAVQYKGEVYRADPTYQPFIRIKELEEVSDYGNVNRIKPYGFDLIYTSQSSGRVNAGWEAISRQWLRMGFSNRWDGYILVQVPKEAQPQDIMVISDFGTFGSAQWQLPQ